MSGAARGEGIVGRFEGRVGRFAIDAAFAIPATGITALSGLSGSGKTTLLRCIAGLTRLPGRLTVGGQVWQDARTFLPPHRRPIGVVFQEASLLAYLSVRGNLAFGARRTRATPTIRLDEVIDLLSLSPLLDRSSANLSGGERQRVALGRALLSQPRLILMDEPLSSLDADSKAEILPYLERLHRSLGTPVIYVSHDAGEIARLADRVLVMRDGRIAPPAEDGDGPRSPLDQARRGLGALGAAEKDALALAAILAGLKPVS